MSSTILAERFNSLCSHYKDSCDINQATVKQRDTLFYLLLAILSLFVMHSLYTDFFNSVAAGVFKKQTDTDLKDKVDLVSTFLWLFIFGVSSKYYQVVGLIERQYEYIHALEEQLERFYKNTPVFSREGKFYLNKYPVFSNWMWFLYTVVFPVLMLFCMAVKAYAEIHAYGVFNIRVAVNMALGVCASITTILYMARIHVKK